MNWPRCETRRASEHVAHYLDTSALVKLVVAEEGTAALRAWLSAEERSPVTCDLSRAELMRAVRRAASDRIVQARAVLDSIALIDLPTRRDRTALSSSRQPEVARNSAARPQRWTSAVFLVDGTAPTQESGIGRQSSPANLDMAASKADVFGRFSVPSPCR